MSTTLDVSVIVPVYCGEPYLEELVDKLHTLRSQWDRDCAPVSLAELILVDDSAIDGSPDLIDRLSHNYPWIVPLHLARNFGQHAATVAGILHSAGDWVVTLDEDLQHSPSDIPHLLRQAVETGSDVVYAKPKTRVHETFFRDLASRGYKGLVKAMTRNPHVKDFNSFRLIRGSVARGASSVCAHDTYFDVALSWFTQRFEVTSLNLKDRRYISSGETGYTFSALLGHARRLLLTSEINLPRFGALVGVALVCLSLLGGFALLLLKVVSPSLIRATGWTSLMLAIVLFGGVIVLLLSILLEYISVLVVRAHGKPLFFTIDRTSDDIVRTYLS